MNRREFVVLSGAAALMPAWARAEGANYAPGLVKSELAAGKTVFVDFYASWCTTCAAQSRVIDALKAANPDYAKNISFIVVDWDVYGRGELSRELNIPRRSTLVVLKGDQELGRVVAGTSKKVIKGLLDVALGAATS